MKFGIKKILLLWFLSLSLTPLLFLVFLELNFSREVIRDGIINNLVSVADNKEVAMRNYVEERTKAISTLARTPSVVEALEKLSPLFLKGSESREYKEAEEEFREFASYYQEKGGYYDLFLINRQGDVIFTVIHEDDFATNLLSGPYRETELAKTYSRAHTMLDIGLSDYRYYSPSNESAMFIAAPVFSQNEFLGVVALQMDISEIMGIVTNYIGLGKTGETVIGGLQGDRVDFLSPLRHEWTGEEKKQVKLGAAEALPIQHAVLGKSGEGYSIDYRGKEIFAVWRYEPYLRWGMVVKIDTEEAFQAIVNLKRRVLFALLITSFLVLLIALFISRSISQPIYKLTVAAKKIIGGNFTLKIDPHIKKMNNEIGEMARSFEKMTGYLIQANVVLDEKVKERTRELGEALAKLKDSSQMIQTEKMSAVGTMVAGVAHELNNPMMGILNYLQYCRTGISPDDKRYKILGDAEHETYRCIKIIKNLLSFSRLESEGTESLIETDMGKTLHSVLSLLAYRIDLLNITVDINIKEGTPRVLARQNNIQQVILNLLSNAIDAVEDSPAKVISIDLSTKEETFFFTITDTGSGMKEEHLRKIFLPFFTTKTVGKGTGLGLSVCDTIITDHGGAITVKSTQGEGSIFTFSLPLKPEQKRVTNPVIMK